MGRDCFMSHSRSYEDFSDFLSGWFRAFAMGSPFLGSGLWCGLTRSIETKSFFLNHIPRSFGMRSPFGLSVLLDTYSIANKGFNW